LVGGVDGDDGVSAIAGVAIGVIASNVNGRRGSGRSDVAKIGATKIATTTAARAQMETARVQVRIGLLV
jgi:hypothetical protein